VAEPLHPKAKGRPDSLATGTVVLLGVQAGYFVGGCILHIYLGRTLGPSAYGIFGVVIAFLVWMEVSLTGGFTYAIRKFGAERPELLPAIARTAGAGQFVYGIMLSSASHWQSRL
jgi:O-antigen/teichoic acid export membrane protein